MNEMKWKNLIAEQDREAKVRERNLQQLIAKHHREEKLRKRNLQRLRATAKVVSAISGIDPAQLVRSKNRNKKWSQARQQAWLMSHRNGIPIKEIANFYGRSARTIKCYIDGAEQ